MRRIRKQWTRFWRSVGQWLRDSNVWKKIGIGSVVVAIIGGMAQAFGGDLYRLLLEPFLIHILLPFLERTAAIPVWGLVVAGVFVLAILIYSFIVTASKDTDSEVTASMVSNLEKMSPPMIRALETSVVDDTRADDLINRLVKAALSRISSAYGGQVIRGSVWIPDPADPMNWLYAFTTIGVEDDGRSRRFYIGASPDDEKNKPGVAGKVYRSKIPELVRFDKSRRKADNPAYIRFGDDGKPVYSSLVAIPLSAQFLELDHSDLRTGNGNKVYGVICLDSPFKHTFDNDPIIAREGKRLLGAAPLLRIIYHLLRWQSRLSHA